VEEAGKGFVIFYGRYRFNAGAYRPSLTAYILSTDGKWVKHSFLLDTGADVTFLPQRSIAMLGISTAGVNVKNDVGGVGGQGVPYIDYQTQVRLISPEGVRVLAGTVNVFLDPHATDVPLLGRDILDTFTCIFDRAKGHVLLLDSPDRYELIRG
jgi:hypothetical protein